MVIILSPFKDDNEAFTEHFRACFNGSPNRIYLTFITFIDSYSFEDDSLINYYLPIITDYFPFDTGTMISSYVTFVDSEISTFNLQYAEKEKKRLKQSVIKKLRKSNLPYTENCFNIVN